MQDVSLECLLFFGCSIRSIYFVIAVVLPLPFLGSIESHLLLSASVSLLAHMCRASIQCPHKTGKAFSCVEFWTHHLLSLFVALMKFEGGFVV